MEDKEMITRASISSCRKYRYELHRIWDETKPLVLFIMLNPSTADETLNDPTIRRCINFAKDWGYGGIMVGNLFPYRSTNPKELDRIDIPHYESGKNANALANMYSKAEKTILAFGNAPYITYSFRSNSFKELYHLGLTKSGNPKHPLYLKKDTQPMKYNIVQMAQLM